MEVVPSRLKHMYSVFSWRPMLRLISKPNQVRQTRHPGHCGKSKDELICDVLLWTPTQVRASVGRPARTYSALCKYSLENLPGAMDDRCNFASPTRHHSNINCCYKPDPLFLYKRFIRWQQSVIVTWEEMQWKIINSYNETQRDLWVIDEQDTDCAFFPEQPCSQGTRISEFYRLSLIFTLNSTAQIT